MVAVVYGALWTATAAWGPDALRRWEHSRPAERPAGQGWDSAGGEREFVSLSVPAPFLVGADWESGSGGAGRDYSGAGGDVRAVWAFGWVGVYRDRARYTVHE